MFEPVVHPVIGEHPMQQAPFKLSATPVPVETGGPLLGADNVPILGGMLGMTWDEIAGGYEDGSLWPAGQPVESYLLEPPEQMPPPHVEEPLPPLTVERRHSDGALGDLRVIEIGGEIGEWAAKLMADQGADVIKVEPPRGAAEREIGPFYEDVPDAERSLHFWHYNTSKRGITLDVTTEDGRALFRRLAADADVLIDSRPLGELDALGLGYEALSADNPGLIMCSITPFGAERAVDRLAHVGPHPARRRRADGRVRVLRGGRARAHADRARRRQRVAHRESLRLHRHHGRGVPSRRQR